MSFQHIPGIGVVHFQDVKRAHVVPGNERHSWLIKKLMRGQSTTCNKCGCKRRYTREYDTYYQMVGEKETTIRPACTGSPK